MHGAYSRLENATSITHRISKDNSFKLKKECDKNNMHACKILFKNA